VCEGIAERLGRGCVGKCELEIGDCHGGGALLGDEREC
jgi:hypothetical protein